MFQAIKAAIAWFQDAVNDEYCPAAYAAGFAAVPI